MAMSTKPDTGEISWRASAGVVTGLRAFGAARGSAQDFNFRDLAGTAEVLIGSADDCAIRIGARGSVVSRYHAVLEVNEGIVRDLDSTNGIRQNGRRRKVIALAPGDRIQIGIPLVVESTEVAALHDLLQRLLGRAPERRVAVDEALIAVRDMALLESALILRGEGAHVGTIERLHDLALGSDHPLVFHAPNEPGLAAVDRARNGLVCINIERPPPDLAVMLASMRLPEYRTRFLVYGPPLPTPRQGRRRQATDTAAILASLHPSTIEIPPLTARADEFAYLLESYGWDAARKLGARRLGFRPQDPEWLWASGAIHDLRTLETDAMYLVALRVFGVTEGARRLGRAHAALSMWALRRGLPS